MQQWQQLRIRHKTALCHVVEFTTEYNILSSTSRKIIGLLKEDSRLCFVFNAVVNFTTEILLVTQI